MLPKCTWSRVSQSPGVGAPFQKQLVKRCVCMYECSWFMSTPTEKLPMTIFSKKWAELSFAFCLSTCLKHKVLILTWTPKASTAGEARLRVSVFGESAENPAPPGTVTYAFWLQCSPPMSPWGAFWGKGRAALRSLKEGEDNYQKSSPLYQSRVKSSNKMSGL